MEGYFNNSGGRFLANVPPVTKNIIIINILLFIASMINQDKMVEAFAMFYPTSPFFKFWQPVTYMFMHGGFFHIFFNMYTLYIFGMVLERVMGSRKFLVFYMLTGLGAVLLHYGVQFFELRHYQDMIQQGNLSAVEMYRSILSTPTVGASGSIYGVLVGYALFYPNSVLTLIFPPVSLKAKWFVLIFAAIELLMGVTTTMASIAHFAHLGGMLFGWLLILWWKKSGRIYYQDKWF